MCIANLLDWVTLSLRGAKVPILLLQRLFLEGLSFFQFHSSFILLTAGLGCPLDPPVLPGNYRKPSPSPAPTTNLLQWLGSSPRPKYLDILGILNDTDKLVPRPLSPHPWLNKWMIPKYWPARTVSHPCLPTLVPAAIDPSEVGNKQLTMCLLRAQHTFYKRLQGLGKTRF